MDAGRIRCLRPGVILVNTARGALAGDQALRGNLNAILPPGNRGIGWPEGSPALYMEGKPL